MNEVPMTFAVVTLLVLATAMRSASYRGEMRVWPWLALVEYLGSALYQFFHGADANGYRQIGMLIARLLDSHFSWGIREVAAVLFQQPSSLDPIVIGPGTNTASMCAAAGLLLFAARSSAYATQALVSGLSMFGAFAIFDAFRDAYPSIAPRRLFIATVLFPSVAFWTSALHKEAFCLMGTGLVLAAWRSIYHRRLRAIVFAPLGLFLLVLFRAPAVPPLVLGLGLHFGSERAQRSGGNVFTRPLYLVSAGVLIAIGLVLVSRVAPDYAVDKIGDTVATQQQAWSTISETTGAGGSAFDIDEPVERSLGSQLASAPISLVNALLRPQIFDVTNMLVLVSALEMSAITAFILLGIRRHGARGLLRVVKDSPFLLMCAVVTVVGCTFVGMTTRNFGTLARYRVPFLPFYGALLAAITEPARAPAPQPSAPAERPLLRRPVRRPARRRALAPPTA